MSGRPHTIAGPGDLTAHYALISIAELKGYLRDAGVASGGEDANLTALVDGLNRDAFGMMGGRFVLDTGVTWDQVYSPAHVSPRLWLEQRPIVSVASVEYGYFQDGAWTAIEPYVSTNYHVDKQGGMLMRETPWFWPRGNMCLRVKYRAGFAAAPPDVKAEMCKWGKVVWNRIVGDRLDKISTGMEAEAQQFRLSEVPDELSRVLERYSMKVVA